ncbi:MAG: hypothetical protein Q8Q17_01680 [bacterium]|nr:hypothetical protein [bacterium]
MKKFFKNLFSTVGFYKNRLNIIGFLVFSVTSLLLIPKQANADGGGLLGWLGVSFGAILGSAIAWVVYVVNYLIATIFGVFISILAWFITIVLQINTNIVSAPIVQNGFTISLAVANLGFVMAIIVIAIMTILRYETYALKKTLWKLVAAAILVNFSLVICAAILNFADTLTNFFLDGFTQSCGTGVSGAINRYDCFANNLANAFAPQRVFLGPNSSTSTVGAYADSQQDALGGGQTFGMIITPLLSLFFPTLFLIITVIALFGLFIMLLIRYVYLGILLILMPMAWLLWIFPITSGQWSKWWSKFIQWTVFAPVVMFFIYLAVLSLGQTNSPEAFLAALRVQSNSSSPIVAGISNFLGGATVVMLGTMLQMAIMVSLLFAGLFMANSMGIMFADTTLKGAKYVTSSFGKFASRRGVIGAGWAMNKARIPKAVEWLQKGVGAKPKGLLAKAYKYSGAEYAGQKLGYGIHAVHVATREGTVDEAEKRVAGMEKREKIGLFSGGTNPEKIAIMKDAAKEGYLKDLDLKNNLKENIFKAYHIEIPNYKDVSEGKGAMLNEEAINALETALTTGNDTTLDEAIRKIVISTTKGKIGSNDNVGDMYGSFGRDEKGNLKTFGGLSGEETQKWLKSLTKNIVTKNFALVSSMIPKMNSKERDNFKELFDGVIADLRATGNSKDAADADEYQKNYDRIILHNTVGYTEAPAPTAGTTGTTPGGATPGGGAPGGASGGGGTTP